MNFELFSFRCLRNWTKLIVSCTMRLQVKKFPTEIRYQFLKKTVYFKNSCVQYLIQRTAKGADFVAWYTLADLCSTKLLQYFLTENTISLVYIRRNRIWLVQNRQAYKREFITRKYMWSAPDKWNLGRKQSGLHYIWEWKEALNCELVPHRSQYFVLRLNKIFLSMSSFWFLPFMNFSFSC